MEEPHTQGKNGETRGVPCFLVRAPRLRDTIHRARGDSDVGAPSGGFNSAEENVGPRLLLAVVRDK